MNKATEEFAALRRRNEDETDVQAAPLVVSDDDTGPLTNIQLLCVAGPELGATFMMRHGDVTIGRGAGEISLTTSDVSRRHARVFRRQRGFWIEDLGSSNGTYVNGSQINEPIELRFGDRVQVGSTILVFTRNDELERRLRQLQKLEAMHEVVNGLAHDFNNTMQVLLVGLDQLKSRAHDDETRSIVDELLTAAMSGGGLARRMLRIGRDKPATQDIVDLEAMPIG